MSIIKEFHFTSNVEGWVAHPQLGGYPDGNIILSGCGASAFDGVYLPIDYQNGKVRYNQSGFGTDIHGRSLIWEDAWVYYNKGAIQWQSTENVEFPTQVTVCDTVSSSPPTSVVDELSATANIDMLWNPPHKSRGYLTSPAHPRLNPPLSIMGGCLKTVSRQNSPSAENYWQLNSTWNDLGVPFEANVVDVTADYLYRWDLKHAGNRNIAEFTDTQAGSGPFELHTNSGSLLGTFSDRIYSIARNSGVGYWRVYPVGSAADPVTFTQPGWGLASGSTITIPDGQQESSNTIKLRLRNLTPTTAPIDIDHPVTYVRFKQDYIKLTINYTGGMIADRKMFASFM